MTHEDLKALIDKATLEQGRSNFEEAIRLAKEVLRNVGDEEDGVEYVPGGTSKRTDNTTGDTIPDHEMNVVHCSALLSLAETYRMRGDYADAHAIALRALNLSVRYDLASHKAIAHLKIGAIYAAMGFYDKALEYTGLAVEHYERHGELISIANAKLNVGLIYRALGSFEMALDYMHDALHTFEKHGQAIQTAIILGNIANVYADLEEYDMALEYYTRALEANVALGDISRSARIKANIATVYISQGLFEEALDCTQKALAIHTSLGANGEVARGLVNSGNIYFSADFAGYNESLAEEYFLRAEELSQQVGLRHLQSSVCGSIARLYEKQGRWEEGLQYVKKHFNLLREVESDAVRKSAQRYQFEREQAEITVRLQTTEQLLHKTLPQVIAKRLMSGEKNIADKFESVSILFADIVGFTPLSTRIEPKKLVELLNNLFTRFDKLTEEYGAERVKTIGDAYMVVAGAPERCDDHALRMAKIALAMIEQTELFSREMGETIRIRIGINSGEAIGAIVGETKFSYDLWGDAVNTASRMESHGEAGKIHCTEEFKHAVETVHAPSLQLHAPSLQLHVPSLQLHAPSLQLHAPSLQLHAPSLQFIPRGEMEIKGKGIMHTYFLEKR